MKQKQINKVINLWRKAKQESITYDVNGKENGIDLSLAKDSFIEKLEKAKDFIHIELDFYPLWLIHDSRI